MARSDILSPEMQCPLCKHKRFARKRFGLFRCEGCEVVLSPSIWLDQANERMEDDWFGENYGARKSSIWVNLFEGFNNRRTLKRIDTRGRQGNRLLEIGVGSGSFLRAAKLVGFDVLGCDLSAPICQRVEREYGIEMHCGVLAELQDGRSFDVIIMNHVLEHVQQPVDFLRDVYRLLAPTGILHLAVPNIDCWEARFSGWTSYEPYHLIYFNPRTLQSCVEVAGFSVETVLTRDSFSGWFLALLRTALGVNRAEGAVTRPLQVSTDRPADMRTGLFEHAYRLTSVLAGAWLWPLRWLQGKLGYGDELVCVVRRVALAREG